MNERVEIKVLQYYRIWLRFQDVKAKVVNLRPFIGKGFTAELINYSKFYKGKVINQQRIVISK